MMPVRTLAVVAMLLVPSAALAQDDDLFPDDMEDMDDPVELPPDDGTDDPTAVPFEEDAPSGADEDPDAPVLAADREAAGAGEGDAGYPAAVVQRPLTLPRGTSRIAYEVALGGLTPKVAYTIPGNDEFLRIGGVLRAQYGITDELQLGLHYGTGTFADDEYHTGKALSVRFSYQVFDWLAPYAEAPLLVDPFQIALSLGARMRWVITDDLALFIDPSVTFAFTDFVPYVEDAYANALNTALADVNQQLDAGDITVIGGAIYQLDPTLGLRASFGVVGNDFSLEEDPGAPLLLELVYAAQEALDLGARVGFMNFGEPGDTFTIGAFAAYRI